MQRCNFLSLQLALLVLGLRAALASGNEVISNNLIIEFTTEAVLQEAHTVGAAQAASVIAADVMQSRPEVATAAAATIPATASLASNLMGSAAAANINVTAFQPFGLVFSGMAVATQSPDDAAALQKELSTNPMVKKIYPDVSQFNSMVHFLQMQQQSQQ
jgi:hypothetical protein